MSTIEKDVLAFYDEHWRYDGANGWGNIRGYRSEDLGKVRERYKTPKHLQDALKEGVYEKTLLLPWVGSDYTNASFKVAIVLREYPLYAHPTPKFRMSGNLMREEVDAVSKQKDQYNVLQRALVIAGLALEAKGVLVKGTVPNPIHSVNQICPWLFDIVAPYVYLTDLVKPFALYANFKRELLVDARVGQTCHSAEMYDFACKQLSCEINVAHANLVLAFGKTWADSYQSAHGGKCGDAAFVVFSHPARNFTWRGLHDTVNAVLTTPGRKSEPKRAASVAEVAGCVQSEVVAMAENGCKSESNGPIQSEFANFDGWYNGKGSWRNDAAVVAVKDFILERFRDRGAILRNGRPSAHMGLCRPSDGLDGMTNFATVTKVNHIQNSMVLVLALGPTSDILRRRELASFRPRGRDRKPQNPQAKKNLQINIPRSDVVVALKRIVALIELAWDNVGPKLDAHNLRRILTKM